METMKIEDKNDPAPTYPTRCYTLKGLTYVPHYSPNFKGQYVRPGYVNATPLMGEAGRMFAGRDSKRVLNTVSELALVAAGAKEVAEMLWMRP